MKRFTPAQITVLQALAAGATVTAAAKVASVSRPTVYHWCDDPAFQQALAFAEQEYALTIRDRLQALQVKALEKLEQVLDHPKASPSVILRATVLLLTNRNWNLPAPSADFDPNQASAAARHFTDLYTKFDVAPSAAPPAQTASSSAPSAAPPAQTASSSAPGAAATTATGRPQAPLDKI